MKRSINSPNRFSMLDFLHFTKHQMDLSKDKLIKVIRKERSGRVQLERRDFLNRNAHEIYCNIEINGYPQKSYVCCCLCKALLKLGQGNKASRNRHIAKHNANGDPFSPFDLDKFVYTFNALHSS